MASTIIIKNKNTGAPSTLAAGELAINTEIGSLYYGSTGGTAVSSSFTFSNITSSGTISASGMIQTAGAISSSTGITASHALFSGNITASGTISASGMIQTAGAISSSTGITASHAFFSGKVTASNDISSSGMIHALKIKAPLAAGTTNSNNVVVVNSSNELVKDTVQSAIFNTDDQIITLGTLGEYMQIATEESPSGNAATAAQITAVDGTADNTDFFIAVLDGATGAQVVETTTKSKLNPSTGVMVTGNATIGGASNIFATGITASLISASGAISSSSGITGSGAFFSGNVTASNYQVRDNINHDGDTNNHISFGGDTQDYQTGGSSRLDISDSGVRLGGANSRVTTILDEDDMASNSATSLATQQSIKSYVDKRVVTLFSHAFGISRATAVGSGNPMTNIFVQGNTTWGVSDRAWIGTYGTGTGNILSGFDPTHIQNGITVPFDVTNIRVDVQLQSNKGATDNSESGSLFLFKHPYTGSAVADTTVNLIPIAMNSTIFSVNGETSYPVFSVSSSALLSGGNDNVVSASRGDLLVPMYRENVDATGGHARGNFVITAEKV